MPIGQALNAIRNCWVEIVSEVHEEGLDVSSCSLGEEEVSELGSGSTDLEPSLQDDARIVNEANIIQGIKMSLIRFDLFQSTGM